MSNNLTDEQRQNELIGEKNEKQDLLTQRDYMARKVAFEVAGIIKTQFPNIPMPEYDKYIAAEEEARQFRERINEIEEELANN